MKPGLEIRFKNNQFSEVQDLCETPLKLGAEICTKVEEISGLARLGTEEEPKH